MPIMVNNCLHSIGSCQCSGHITIEEAWDGLDVPIQWRKVISPRKEVRYD